jgi:hypothetical protein
VECKGSWMGAQAVAGDLRQLFEEVFAKPPSTLEQRAARAALGVGRPGGRRAAGRHRHRRGWLVSAGALAERLEVEAEFRVGSFESTGLAGDSVAAVVTFDALLFAPRRVAGDDGPHDQALLPGGPATTP